ncbi:MAG: DUF3786 domain-containing protein [Candidatus Omnitrophica bacterium]|nr:DUF3786 domain-containing protein [Candidatus Omnitrophota bacterium]
MSYDLALEKAWLDIESLSERKRFSIKMLADEYEIDLENRRILSVSCNAQPKEYISIILLHYLIQKLRLKELPKPLREWIDFYKLEGGDTYYSVFRSRVIEVLLRKYGRNPQVLWEVLGRVPARKVQIGDVGIVIQVFEEVPMLVVLYKADEEFEPEANVLFDKNITEIFCTEDIIVLAEMIAHLL